MRPSVDDENREFFPYCHSGLDPESSIQVVKEVCCYDS
jgi:hypothetical protein